MNMRGSGDGEELCPLLYNAGLDGDLLAALGVVASLVPRVAVVGFSLGANLTLLAAGRRRERLPGALAAVAAVSPPLDLSACADALERRDNRLYQRYFMRMLAAAYRRRHRRRPDLFPADREAGLRTVREYDDRITAPFGGYDGAADYYARSSAGPLARLDRPADPGAVGRRRSDDPGGLGGALADLAERATGDHARRAATSASWPGRSAPGWFWAAERALDFLEGRGRRQRSGRQAAALPWGPYYSRSTGSRVLQTFSATTAWPSAVGWMPSGWLSSGSPATPSRRKGTRTAPFASASSG